MASCVAPARSRSWPAGSLRCSAMASSRCSVETNSSLKRPASSNARSSTSLRGCARYIPGCMAAAFGRLPSSRGASARPAGMRAGMHARGLRQVAEQTPRLAQDRVRVRRALFQHGPDDAFPFFRQGDEQVQREHHLAFALLRNGLRLLQCLLRLLSESVQTEHAYPPYNKWGRLGAEVRLPAPDLAWVGRARPLRAYALTSTLIWRGLAASVLGSVTVSTPFL